MPADSSRLANESPSLRVVAGVVGFNAFMLGDLMNHRSARKLFYMIADEVVSIAKKAGVEIEGVKGALNPTKFASSREGYHVFLRYFLLMLVKMKCRQTGAMIWRIPESDNSNVTLVKLGEEHGLP
jgi:hypothetical protein